MKMFKVYIVCKKFVLQSQVSKLDFKQSYTVNSHHNLILTKISKVVLIQLTNFVKTADIDFMLHN